MTVTDTSAPRLLIIAPAPVLKGPEGITLDSKFVEAMKRHCAQWPGPVRCLLRRGARTITYGVTVSPDGLDFELDLLAPNENIGPDHLRGHDIVLCSADDHTNLHVADLGRTAGVRVVYAIEYILETRLQIAWLDIDRGLMRRLRAILWNLLQERRRRRAIKASAGLQSNGYPAHRAYAGLSRDSMVYLANQMTPELLCTDAAMRARREHLLSGGPIRLVYSGRLEPMKGVQDLIPVAEGLRARGVPFSLDIFGAGRLGPDIRQRIENAGLSRHARLHEPVDFRTGLVPWVTENADIYLCCHKQSDPSCTYVESMGCGLAVAGYGNRMWSDLLDRSGGGWCVQMNDIEAMADCIAGLHDDRQAIAERCARALEFARAHGFRDEFAKRMAHLRGIVNAPSPDGPRPGDGATR